MRKPLRRSLEFYAKMMRQPGTPESIGRGVATGFFTAFILPAGHMLVAFPLAALVRGARGAAVISTWIINPLTIPVLYPFQCWLGSLILGNHLSDETVRQAVSNLIHHPSVRMFSELGADLIASFFAGGIVMGSVAALTGYLVTTAMARRYRNRRKDKRRA